jgi:hypothetical protein
MATDTRNILTLSTGLLAGIMIAVLDNFAAYGEVSPALIVFFLLIASAGAAVIWDTSGWITAAITWIFLPFAQLIRQFFGLPDTLHPATYASILKIAMFSMVITAAGTATGILIRRMTTGTPDTGSESGKSE